MPVVKIINPSPYDWRGTQCFIDGNKVPRVKSVDFHVAVDEVPTFVFEMMAEPDIEVECLAQISFTSQSITDAISVLRHELLQHGEIYHGFKASLKSALEHYNYCGLPFEPEEEIDLNEVAAEIRKLQSEIKEIDAELKPFFDELGLDFPFEVEGK